MASVRALTLALLLAGCEIEGEARIVDGDTLAIHGQAIRLYGIDAPELAQHCGDPLWPCGRAARDRLAALTAGQPVTCQPRDRDRYGRVVALCRVAGRDLGRILVQEGLALAFIRYAADYLPEEAAASAAARGVWSGPFAQPQDYRRGRPVR